MQLLIILALLLYGGKSGAQNIIEEVKPVLESIGGDEMRDALKSAEEISSVLSAVGGIAGTVKPDSGERWERREERSAIAFPLKPVNDIADRDIAYSLSQYINAEN